MSMSKNNDPLKGQEHFGKSLIERWQEDEDPFGMSDGSPIPDDEDEDEEEDKSE